jgi:hypothetical protein
VTAEADFAWACGLFEGEGSVIHRGHGRSMHRGLSLGMTDLDVLERFASIMGGRIGQRSERGGAYKPMWRWQLARWRDVEPLLRRMLPYMGARRRGAMEKLLADPPKRRSRGGWYPGEVCEGCGRDDRPHRARGRCDPCYTRLHRTEHPRADRA